MKPYKGIYLDNAATSYPKSRAVIAAVRRCLIEEGGNPGRSGHPLSLRAAMRVYSAREAIAELFSLSDERGVVFTKNATEALNLAIYIYTRAGGHVLCDDMAHNAMARPLYALAETGSIRLSFFAARAGAGALAKEISDDTVLVCCTHASNICSCVCDAAALARVCQQRGVAFLLDASQSAGHLPISAEDIPADVICLPAHKGLGGIMGAGAALFPKLREDFPTFLSGGSGSLSAAHSMPPSLPEHFEAGTLPLPAIAALEAGARERLKRGTEPVRKHLLSLEVVLREGLGAMRGIRLYGEAWQGNGILSFTHEALRPESIAERLAVTGVSVRSGLHCAPLAHRVLGTPAGGAVRVSLGEKNTKRDCERFLDALHGILR